MTTAPVTSLNASMAVRTACISGISALSLGKCRQVMLSALISIILLVPFLIIAAASPVSAQSSDSVGVIYFDEDERVFGVSSDHTDIKQAERVAKKRVKQVVAASVYLRLNSGRTSAVRSRMVTMTGALIMGPVMPLQEAML
jgi:hypothetical protein